MNPLELVIKKREGRVLSRDEIDFLINGYTKGTVPDYQMAAFLMAYYFQDMRLGGVDPEELAGLTDAMAKSGDSIDLSRDFQTICDKHSTGGVGDKLTFICAPIIAAAGLPSFLMSGRGLGHTGGTLDKMEAVPGTRVTLSVTEITRGLKEAGLIISGQTGDLAPADKKIYALRDVTGTVPSVGLISASILSKKLCVNPATLVLDVKYGSGAFMKTPEDAGRLAETMMGILKVLKRPAAALITDMDEPLGRMIGNALEIKESIRILKNEKTEGLADVIDISVALAAEIFVLTGRAASPAEGGALARSILASGKAYESFRACMAFQGADVRALDNPDLLPKAARIVPVKADRNGIITAIDSEAVGMASNALGAGRFKKEDVVDPAVGLEVLRKKGDFIREGEEIALLHVNNADAVSQVSERIRAAVSIGDEKPPARARVLRRIV